MTSNTRHIISYLFLTIGLLWPLSCISPDLTPPPVANPKERLKECLEYGRLYLQTGNFISILRAEKQFQRALKLDPTCAEAWLRLGDIYYIFYERELWNKRPEEARQRLEYAYRCYLCALQYRPDYPEAYVGLSVLEYCLQRYDKAVEYLLKARAILSPASGEQAQNKYLLAQIHWMLGRCYNVQGKLPEAYEELKGYLKLIPKGDEADNIRLAIKEIERVLGSPPENKPETPAQKQ